MVRDAQRLVIYVSLWTNVITMLRRLLIGTPQNAMVEIGRAEPVPYTRTFDGA